MTVSPTGAQDTTTDIKSQEEANAKVTMSTGGGTEHLGHQDMSKEEAEGTGTVCLNLLPFHGSKTKKSAERKSFMVEVEAGQMNNWIRYLGTKET